jgi:hypothetical protein
MSKQRGFSNVLFVGSLVRCATYSPGQLEMLCITPSIGGTIPPNWSIRLAYSAGSRSLSSSRLTSCETNAYLTPRCMASSSTASSKRASPWQVNKLAAMGARYGKQGSPQSWSSSRFKTVAGASADDVAEESGAMAGTGARVEWWMSRRLLF